MAILDAKVLKDVEKALKHLTKPVVLKYFTQPFECGYCKETHQLLEELVATSPLLSLEVHQFDTEKEMAAAHGVDKIPAIVILDADKKDYGIRFYGIPAGYEFSSLLSAILMVSTGITKLSDKAKKYLDEIDKPVHMQVFVTPTCPYCPQAVILAQQMAFYSPHVSADMVELTEFPHLTEKYSVQGVPRTTINEDHFQEGAAPESMIIAKIKEALK